MDYGWTSEPTEPENSHAPVCVSPLAVGNPSPVVTSAGRTLEEVPMYPVLPGSTEGSHNMSNVGPDMSSIRSGHNGPMQGFPVSVVDVEKGDLHDIEKIPSLEKSVTMASLSSHVRTPISAQEDLGRGYDDWIKMPPLTPSERPLAILKHKCKQYFVVLLLTVPSVILCYLFSLLVEAAVKHWNSKYIAPLQSNPIIAGMIGEPFHELSPGLIYGTFTVLVVLCPYLCCLMKMFGHLLFMYGRQLLPVWRTAFLWCSLMGGGNMMAAIIMQASGAHVPRIAWMGMIFVALFSGLFFCARQAGRILDYPGLTWLYFRAGFTANVLLYVYAVLFPFWFFATQELGVKLFLAIGFHPMVEYVVAFMLQHTATQLRHNDPATSISPGFHYNLLFALYGSFLLVNFEQAWQNILGFTLLRAWSVFSKVFAQELTYFTYLACCKTPEETAKILSSVRFKRYRNDIINCGLLIESVAICVAGAVTFLFKFNKYSDGHREEATGLVETLSVVGLQLLIGVLCDALADAGLAYRGSPWHNAWQTQMPYAIPKFAFISFVSVGMFLFYFYPFLASRMVI